MNKADLYMSNSHCTKYTERKECIKRSQYKNQKRLPVGRLFFVLTLFVSFAILLGGCKVKSADDSYIKVGVFLFDGKDAYIASAGRFLQLEYELDDRFLCKIYDAENDQKQQTSQIKKAVSEGCDILVVNLVNVNSDKPAKDILEIAKEKDISVIFFNREVSDAVINSCDKCVYVGTDGALAGRMQGELIADFVRSEGLDVLDINGDGRISYLMLRGKLGEGEAFGRTLHSVLAANEELSDLLLTFPPASSEGKPLENDVEGENAGSVVSIPVSGGLLIPSIANVRDETQPADGVSPYYICANWDRKEAFALLNKILQRIDLSGGCIELIIANNDYMALGAMEALQAVKYNTGKDAGASGAEQPEEGVADAESAAAVEDSSTKQVPQRRFIPIFGIDAIPEVQDAIENGQISGTVEKDAEGMAHAIVHMSQNIASGIPLMSNTHDFTVDDDCDKIRIPYRIYKHYRIEER